MPEIVSNIANSKAPCCSIRVSATCGYAIASPPRSILAAFERPVHCGVRFDQGGGVGRARDRDLCDPSSGQRTVRGTEARVGPQKGFIYSDMDFF
jgi:hypothetical protein